MNQQDALRYLMFEHTSDSPSKLYGATPIIRASTAWKIALELSDGDESKVTTEVLDEIIDAIERGDNIVNLFISGEYARGFKTSSQFQTGSESARGS